MMEHARAGLTSPAHRGAGCERKRSSTRDGPNSNQDNSSTARSSSRQSSAVRLVLSPQNILLLVSILTSICGQHALAQQGKPEQTVASTTTVQPTSAQTTSEQTPTTNQLQQQQQQNVRQQQEQLHFNQFQQHHVEQGQVSDSDLLADIEAIDLQKDRQSELSQQPLNYNLNVEQQAQASTNPQHITTVAADVNEPNQQQQLDEQQQSDANGNQPAEPVTRPVEQQQLTTITDNAASANPYIRLSNIAIINSTANGNSSTGGAGGRELKLMRIYVIDLDQKLVIGSGSNENAAQPAPAELVAPQQSHEGETNRQQVDSSYSETPREQPAAQQQQQQQQQQQPIVVNEAQSIEPFNQQPHPSVEQQSVSGSVKGTTVAADNQPNSQQSPRQYIGSKFPGAINYSTQPAQQEQPQHVAYTTSNDYHQQAGPAGDSHGTQESHAVQQQQYQPANDPLEQGYVFVNRDSLQANISEIADHEARNYQPRGHANQTTNVDSKQQAQTVEYHLVGPANYSQQQQHENEAHLVQPHVYTDQQSDTADHQQASKSAYRKTHNGSQQLAYAPALFAGNNPNSVGYPHFVGQNQTPIVQVVATYPGLSELQQQQQQQPPPPQLQYAGLVPQYISPQYKSDPSSLEPPAGDNNRGSALPVQVHNATDYAIPQPVHERQHQQPQRLVFRQVSSAAPAGYSSSQHPPPSDYQPQFQYPLSSTSSAHGPTTSRPSDSWRPIDISGGNNGGHQYHQAQASARYKYPPSSTPYSGSTPDHDVVSLEPNSGHRAANSTGYNPSTSVPAQGYNQGEPHNYHASQQVDQSALEYPQLLANSSASRQHKASAYPHSTRDKPQPGVYVAGNSLDQTAYNYENGSQPFANQLHQYEQQPLQSQQSEHQYNVSTVFSNGGARQQQQLEAELPKIPQVQQSALHPNGKAGRQHGAAKVHSPVVVVAESYGAEHPEQASKPQTKMRPKTLTSRRPHVAGSSRQKKLHLAKARLPAPASPESELIGQQQQYAGGPQSALEVAVSAAAEYQHQQQAPSGETADQAYSVQPNGRPSFGAGQHYNIRPAIGGQQHQHQHQPAPLAPLPPYFRPAQQPSGKSLLSWETISSVASGAAKRLPGALSSIFSPFASASLAAKNPLYPTVQSANYHLLPAQQFPKSAHYSGDVASFHRPYPLRHMNAPETYSDVPPSSDVSMSKYQAQDNNEGPVEHNVEETSGADEQPASDDLGGASTNDSQGSSSSSSSGDQQSAAGNEQGGNDSQGHAKSKGNSTLAASVQGGTEPIIADLAEISAGEAPPQEAHDSTVPKPTKTRAKSALKGGKKGQLDSAQVAVLSSIEHQLGNADSASPSLVIKSSKSLAGPSRRRPKKRPVVTDVEEAAHDDSSGSGVEPSIVSGPSGAAASSGDQSSSLAALAASSVQANGAAVSLDSLPADQQRLLLASKSKAPLGSTSGVLFAADGTPIVNGAPFAGPLQTTGGQYLPQMRPMFNVGPLQANPMSQPISGLSSVKIGQFRITPQTQFVQSIIEPSRQMLGQYFKQYIGQLGQFG